MNHEDTKNTKNTIDMNMTVNLELNMVKFRKQVREAAKLLKELESKRAAAFQTPRRRQKNPGL